MANVEENPKEKGSFLCSFKSRILPGVSQIIFKKGLEKFS